MTRKREKDTHKDVSTTTDAKAERREDTSRHSGDATDDVIRTSKTIQKPSQHRGYTSEARRAEDMCSRINCQAKASRKWNPDCPERDPERHR